MATNGTAPDVRVRISADDEATEVFRKVLATVQKLAGEQAKADRAARGAASGTRAQADAARDAAGGLDRMASGLSRLVALVGAVKLAQFVKGTVDTADAIFKLSQKTGVATETLSALALAATTADVSQEQLGVGLKFLAKFLVDVQQGAKPALATLQAIGLTQRDLAGLDTGAAFKRIADQLARYADGAGKATVATQIFGRAGTELIPLLNDVAGQGLAQADERAKRLGLSFSRDAAQAAQRFNDDLTTLKNTAAGVAAAFTSAVIPALSAFTEAASDAVGDLPQSVKTFGASFTIVTAGMAGAVIAANALTSALTSLAAAEGAVALGLSATGIGAIIVGLGLLAAAILTVADARRREREEREKAVRQGVEDVTNARALIAQYRQEATAIASGQVKGEALRAARQRQHEITDKLIAISPAYRNALQKEGQTALDTAAAFERLNAEQVQAQRVKLAEASTRLAQLQDEARRLDADRVAAVGSDDKAAARDAVTKLSRVRAAADAAQAEVTALAEGLAKIDGLTPASGKPDIVVPDANAAKQAADARLQVERQAAQSDLALAQASARLIAQANEAAYAAGLQSLGQYYAERLRAAAQATREEVAALERQRAALEAAPVENDAERVKRAGERAQLDAQIRQKQIEGTAALAAVAEQQRVAEQALDEERSAAARRLLDLTGQQRQAAEGAILAEIAKYDELLAKLNVVGDARRQAVQRFGDALFARADFDEVTRQAERAMGDVELARRRIANEVTLGLRSEASGQRAAAAEDIKRLPALAALAATQAEIARNATDPEMARQAAANAQALADMAANAAAVADNFTRLKTRVLDATESSLATFLGSTITQVRSIGEGLRELALSIVGSVQQILGEDIARAAIDRLRAAIGGGGAASAVDAAQRAAAAAATAAEQKAAAVALGTAGATVGGAATQTHAAAGELASAGGVVLSAAAAISAAAARLAAAAAAAGGASVASLVAEVGGLDKVFKLAAGGYVRGPGTATSDSIPARLSAGEYVVRAAAVRQVGVDTLDALNRGMALPPLRRLRRPGHFADGGLVAAAAGAALRSAAPGGPQRVEGGLDAHITLDPDALLAFAGSRAFGGATLDHIRSNRQKIRAVLGIA